MDEVKKWDLDQLPGYEAIEEPEMEYKTADINKKMKILDDRIEKYSDTLNKNVDLANEAKEEGNENKYKYYMRKNKERLGEYKELKK